MHWILIRCIVFGFLIFEIIFRSWVLIFLIFCNVYFSCYRVFLNCFWFYVVFCVNIFHNLVAVRIVIFVVCLFSLHLTWYFSLVISCLELCALYFIFVILGNIFIASHFTLLDCYSNEYVSVIILFFAVFPCLFTLQVFCLYLLLVFLFWCSLQFYFQFKRNKENVFYIKSYI